MIKQYYKQALAQLRQHPLISIIGIVGTALSIFLIMLVVMMQQVKVAPFSPEPNRNRFLHVHYMSISHKDWGNGTSNGPVILYTAPNTGSVFDVINRSPTPKISIGPP